MPDRGRSAAEAQQDGDQSDIAILVRRSLKEVLVDLVQGTLKVTDRWRWDKALSIQGEKLAAIFFTWRYKIINQE